MANVKVLFTDGDKRDLLKEFPEALVLHLIPRDSVEDNKKMIGDFVTGVSQENIYAIISKEELNDKNIPEAVRLGLVQLFKYLIEEDKKPSVILMDNFAFNSYKSAMSFICILRELMLTYFGEAFEEEITLVIYSCKKELVKIK